MSSQSSSDPLPYVQVDRAVKPRAAMLADAIGVSRQHAMGSLIEWWELCGDPRELERIIERTPDGEEPAVLLTAEDAALRFRLASTREVEAVTLARIGLLEEREDGRFRVRGMSRYFEPVIRRIQARDAAAKGGRISAEKRRKEHGTAQPTGGRGSGAGSEVASEVAQAETEATTEAEPKRHRSGDRSDSQAEPNPSGQRSAVSGHLSLEAAPASRSPRETDQLCADFREVIGSDYVWGGAKDGKAFAKLRKHTSLEEIRARWLIGLRAPVGKWQSVRTVAQLASKWNDLANTSADNSGDWRSRVDHSKDFFAGVDT